MIKMNNFDNRIFVGITCTSSRRNKNCWKKQLQEINKFRIKEIALFLTTLNCSQRKKLYKELEKSCVEKVKLVHIRGQDFTKPEIEYFYNRYKTRLFNCHEGEFDRLYKKFPRFRKNIVLELNYDNNIENKLEPNRMGGFCLDLSHFKAAEERHSAECGYVMKRLKNTKFKANHLNGYGKRNKTDLHFVTSKHQFDYLKELPKCLFGEVIALELENSIKKQLEFKEYLVKMLQNKVK